MKLGVIIDHYVWSKNTSNEPISDKKEGKEDWKANRLASSNSQDNDSPVYNKPAKERYALHSEFQKDSLQTLQNKTKKIRRAAKRESNWSPLMNLTTCISTISSQDQARRLEGCRLGECDYLYD